MGARQCPNCLMWVTDAERQSGQCPGCKSFFESEIPGSATSNSGPPPAAGAPLIQTHGYQTPTARAKRSAGIGSYWWVILLVVIGMRACRAVMRSTERSSRPTYDQIDFDSGQTRPYVSEQLREIIERSRKERAENQFQMGPEEDFDLPEDTNELVLPELPGPEPFPRLELQKE